MDIGRADHAEGVGIDADPVGFAKTFDQRITGVVQARAAALAAKRSPLLLALTVLGAMQRPIFFEATVFVCAENPPGILLCIRIRP